MGIVKTQDGAEIFYKDWGDGPAVVFSHGWPLDGDAWDNQLHFMASNGFRAVAHDRRGHGRSAQVWNGNDMDHYADDLAAVIEALDLTDAVLVGHSTGGGEVVRYIARHGTTRVRKTVLVDAVPPLMLKTSANPEGTPIEVFDEMRAKVLADPSQTWKDLATPFYGANRPGSKISQGVLDQFWLLGMTVGLKAAYDCIKQFSESDFNVDLTKVDVPTLIIHGDDDQIVPLEDSGMLSVKIIPDAELKIYPGAPHGLFVTHTQQFNDDLLAFVKA